MWERVLQLLAVSCRHRHISQPFSAASLEHDDSSHGEWERVKQASSGHYVVCLACGKRFGYDWSKMRIMK
jgi:hypothetical protein